LALKQGRTLAEIRKQRKRAYNDVVFVYFLTELALTIGRDQENKKIEHIKSQEEEIRRFLTAYIQLSRNTL
jgi:hypothetical protein